jgi:hypothetical protein
MVSNRLTRITPPAIAANTTPPAIKPIKNPFREGVIVIKTGIISVLYHNNILHLKGLTDA